MKTKSALAMAVLAAGVLVSLLLPSQATAAGCVCLSTRFSATGSAIGSTCPEAEGNLIDNLSFAADQSCLLRGFAGACNVTFRVGTCSPDFFTSGRRVDGSAKYSCVFCSFAEPSPSL